MPALPMIIGHTIQREMFQHITQSDMLSHAYLFSGPQGVGKLHFTQFLARFLQCEEGLSLEDIIKGSCACPVSQYDDILKHPDIFYRGGSLVISEVRQLRRALALSPYIGRYKIAILDNAEGMTIEAANALLKVLEEPRDNVIFILITAQRQRVLPTIVSRCDTVRFYYVPDVVMKKNLDIGSIEDTRPHWEGRPGYALQSLQNSSFAQSIKEYKEDFILFLNGNLKVRFGLTEKYAKREKYDVLAALAVWMEHARTLPSSSRSFHMQRQLIRMYRTLVTTNANIHYMLNHFAVTMHTPSD